MSIIWLPVQVTALLETARQQLFAEQRRNKDKDEIVEEGMATLGVWIPESLLMCAACMLRSWRMPQHIAIRLVMMQRASCIYYTAL